MAAKKGQGQGQVMLQIQHLPISSVRPADYNPRKISAEQMARLKRSLTEFGFVDPIIVNSRTGNIVGGHQRVAAAEALGYETVPVVEVDLDDAKEKALNVALNKQGGEWDFQALPGLLAEIQAGGIDLELTGFTQDELDAMIAETTDVEVLDALTDPDDVPEPPAEPITKPGDLWLLGRHRLLCGDSTVVTDVDRLIGPEVIDAVYTDPPYGIDYAGKGIKGATKGGNHGRIVGDQDADAARRAFALAATLSPELSIWWGANYYCDAMPGGHAWIVWDKKVVGDVYSAAEMAWTNRTGRTRMFTHQWHGMVKASESGEARQHPTQKPVAMAEWAFNQFDAGTNVLDLFGGSGSTLIAAERTGRNAYLMELDPRYCDVIVRRWEQHTGQTAVLEAHHGHTDKVHP